MSYVCRDCPRDCGAKRNEYEGQGFCRTGTLIPVAKVMTHMWEEPLLCGTGKYARGTENIFLYGCNLKCVFCQNAKISGNKSDFDRGKLRFFDAEGFGELLINASETRANNVGIVAGDHFVRQISEAITPSVRERIRKPLVFNCGGYIYPSAVGLLEGKIDVFMPDLKYLDSETAAAYSHAKDYPEVAKEAIKSMFSAVGPFKTDENGLIKSGVIIRHLIMPGKIYDTLSVIDWVNETFAPGDVVFSLMSQYTPVRRDFPYKELNRPISRSEKKKAVQYLEACGNITLAFIQEDGTVSESFIPDF